jgi:WhiB family redox-sensing transcriptional regulator
MRDLWQDSALCRNADLEIFFPVDDLWVNTLEEAKKYCDRCDVRTECLAHALKHERFGIWAGTMPSERVRIRKSMGMNLTHLTIWQNK